MGRHPICAAAGVYLVQPIEPPERQLDKPSAWFGFWIYADVKSFSRNALTVPKNVANGHAAAPGIALINRRMFITEAHICFATARLSW
jgi:hypothetical protein